MSDSIYFPQTVEEFMESYKIVDSEEIYSNGIEYVPIFRMKQWFNENPNVINHDEKVKADAIDEYSEKCFDEIENVLHEKDLEISLNQALTIYARIMNVCNGIVEQMKGDLK